MSEKIQGNAAKCSRGRLDLVRQLIVLGIWVTGQSLAGDSDPRLRTVLYNPDEVYRLPARIGYEIELEFQHGERFLGLGAGDVEGLTFKAAANYLFIKPKAANVHTNVTVLTDRRVYRFDYMTLAPDSTIDQIDTVYALRFLYADAPTNASTAANQVPSSAPSVEHLLLQSDTGEGRNFNYWYCGARELKPISTWDDGVHTHLRFGAHAELPAVFVRNEDGSESLVNLNIENDELVVQRVARRFLLRRGKLLGCVLNRSFSGGGDTLSSKTVSPHVERKLRGMSNEAGP